MSCVVHGEMGAEKEMNAERKSCCFNVLQWLLVFVLTEEF